jgi:RNA polymerase sigma factor for flagellar operon FliA
MRPAIDAYRRDAGKVTRSYSSKGRSSLEEDDRVLRYLPMVKGIASKISMRLPHHIHVEDLRSAGIIGLLDAIEKYDPSRGVPFEAYAEFRIRGAILDELRLMDRTPRSLRLQCKRVEDAYSKLGAHLGRPPTDEEMAKEMEISLDGYDKILRQINSVLTVSLNNLIGNSFGVRNKELLDAIVDDSVMDPLEQLQVEELKESLAKAIEELPEKHKLVLSLYYYEDLNMKEIGKILEITESRVSQIHAKCMLALRKKIKGAKLT